DVDVEEVDVFERRDHHDDAPSDDGGLPDPSLDGGGGSGASGTDGTRGSGGGGGALDSLPVEARSGRAPWGGAALGGGRLEGGASSRIGDLSETGEDGRGGGAGSNLI